MSAVLILFTDLEIYYYYYYDKSGESLFDKDFYCDICRKWFDTEPDMINHRKAHQKALHVNSLDGDRLYITFVKILFSARKI